MIAVGNARGAGLSTKTGTVTGIHQGITITDENGTSRLTGLIKTNAALEPGDSGGPLLSSGRVVGIDAAASRSFSFRGSAGGEGYAIPINLALSIARQIESGRQTQNVHIGATAFLGVVVTDPETLGQSSRGAVVQQVASGSPADHAGIGEADLITALRRSARDVGGEAQGADPPAPPRPRRARDVGRLVRRLDERVRSPRHRAAAVALASIRRAGGARR